MIEIVLMKGVSHRSTVECNPQWSLIAYSSVCRLLFFKIWSEWPPPLPAILDIAFTFRKVSKEWPPPLPAITYLDVPSALITRSALVSALLLVGKILDCGILTDKVMWHVAKLLLPIGVSCDAAEEIALAGGSAVAGEGAIAAN